MFDSLISGADLLHAVIPGPVAGRLLIFLRLYGLRLAADLIQPIK
jgi:hypothetical protein